MLSTAEDADGELHGNKTSTNIAVAAETSEPHLPHPAVDVVPPETQDLQNLQTSLEHKEDQELPDMKNLVSVPI